MRFGEPDGFSGRNPRPRFGANQSSYVVDTAKEFEGARGLTLQSVHGSEVAFWPDLKRKLTTLDNAIDFTDPNTLGDLRVHRQRLQRVQGSLRPRAGRGGRVPAGLHRVVR
jgi:hypothetical protein